MLFQKLRTRAKAQEGIGSLPAVGIGPSALAVRVQCCLSFHFPIYSDCRKVDQNSVPTSQIKLVRRCLYVFTDISMLPAKVRNALRAVKGEPNGYRMNRCLG